MAGSRQLSQNEKKKERKRNEERIETEGKKGTTRNFCTHRECAAFWENSVPFCTHVRAP